MVYKHRMRNGKIRHYSSKGAYENSLKGMFANQYQKKNHARKIAKTKTKRRLRHRGVGKVSSVTKKDCATCGTQGVKLTDEQCKICREEFAKFKQPKKAKREVTFFRPPPDIRLQRIRAAIREDNSNIGNIMNTDPQFREKIDRQTLEGMLAMNRGWVATVGREEAIKKFNEEAWGDAYFVLWGYQNGDNHAFLENRIGDRYVILRNDRNTDDMRMFENGDVFEADLDAANQIYIFDYQNRGFGVMFWDLQELRSQRRKVYEGEEFGMTTQPNIPIPPDPLDDIEVLEDNADERFR